MHIEKLTRIKNELNPDNQYVYNFDEIIKFYEIKHELDENYYLFINKNDGTLNYALFEFHYQCSDGNQMLDIIFHGYGFDGTRDMRHTYFGYDGYVFYLPIDIMIKSLTILKQYFD